MSPLISVIVPVHNVEPYVWKCLKSIAAQSYTLFECIVVENGSTDLSGKICYDFCAQDSRFRVIHEERPGVGYARNTGLAEAKGDFIQFVDSDDTLLPNMLETLYCLISSGHYDWASSGFRKTDTDDNLLYLSNPEQTEPLIINNEGGLPLIQWLLFNSKWNHVRLSVVWNKLYSRRIIGETRFQTGNHAEDFLFNYHIFLKTRKAVCSPLCLYNYTSRPGSIMLSSGKEAVLESFMPYIILEETTANAALCRPVFLKKAYRTMLTKQFSLMGTPYYERFLQLCADFRKKTLHEYYSEKNITLIEKTIFRFFWAHPGFGKWLFHLMGN